MSTVKHLSERVLEDLKRLCPDMKKNPREKLALMVGCAVESQRCNLAEWASKLPIETERDASRYTWVERFFRTHTVDDKEVMRAFARQACAAGSQNNQTLVICMDQTSIGNDHGIIMVSLWVQNRGVPLFWHTEATAGNIGFGRQKLLLEQLDMVLPEGASVLFLGDRFYGTAALVKACQQRGWDYRLRLKGNLTLQHESGELTTADVVKLPGFGIINAELYGTGIKTNIGVINELGHPEPWIIAQSASPTKTTVMDYELRWSIECMFSDLKSKGFGLEQTHLQIPAKVTRLILVLSIAMHWAVIIGIQKQSLKKTLPPRKLNALAP